jgi:hypothetical protein
VIQAFVSGVVNGESRMHHVDGEPVLKVPLLSVAQSRRQRRKETPIVLTLWGWRAEKYERVMTPGRMLAASGELSVYNGELDLKTHEIDFLSPRGLKEEE